MIAPITLNDPITLKATASVLTPYDGPYTAKQLGEPLSAERLIELGDALRDLRMAYMGHRSDMSDCCTDLALVVEVLAGKLLIERARS